VLAAVLAGAGCGGDDKDTTETLPVVTDSNPDQGTVPVVRPGADTDRRPVTRALTRKVKLGVPRRQAEMILGPPGRVLDPEPKSGTICTLYGAAKVDGRIATKQVWLVCYDKAGKVNIVTNPATG